MMVLGRHIRVLVGVPCSTLPRLRTLNPPTYLPTTLPTSTTIPSFQFTISYLKRIATLRFLLKASGDDGRDSVWWSHRRLI